MLIAVAPTECDTCCFSNSTLSKVLLSLCFSRCFLSPLLPRLVVLFLVGVVVEVVHRLLSPLRDVVGIFSPYVHARRHTCPPSQLPAHPRPLRLQQQQQQHPWLITTISQLLLGLPASPPPSAENSMREPTHFAFVPHALPQPDLPRPASLGLQISPTRSTESLSRRAFISPLWSSVSPRFISSRPYGLRTPLPANDITKLTFLLVCRRVRPRQVDPS